MKKSPEKKESSSSKPAGRKTEPDFTDKVFAIARKIPKGRVTSYGAIAERAGIRLTARMVGWAMHQAGKAHPPVPAHRVVNSKGLLTGKDHFATPTLMQELLEQEGVEIRNNQVVGFADKFWNPPLPKKNTALPKKIR